MRRGLRYGVLTLSALFGLCVVAVALGALIRSRVKAEAARYHLDVTVGGVWPGWMSVRLVDVVVRPERVEGVTARVGEVRLEASRNHRVNASGVSVAIEGTPGELGDRLAEWRRVQSPPVSGAGVQRRPSGWTIESMSISWADSANAAPRLTADEVGIAFDGAIARLAVGSATVRVGSGALVVEHGVGAADAHGSILDAHAASASVEWTPHEAKGAQARPGERDTGPGTDWGVTQLVGGPPGTRAASDAIAGRPLLPLPDLRGTWTIGAALGQRVTEVLSIGTTLRVDAFTWRITPALGVPFTVGPGPVTVERTDSTLELRFSTGQEAGGTPLSLQGTLSTADRDDVLSLDGGPIALSLLGVREGAAGLVDVARTTMTGRIRVVLSDRGGTLTFAGEGGVTGLSLSDPRIAPDLVRDLGLSFHAHGAVTADGGLRLDDFGASMGFARLEGGARLQQQSDAAVVGLVHFDVPSTSCQALVTSVPDALLPALAGTEMAGTFAAHGQVEFDTRALDQLVLNYDAQDLCRLVHVPPPLARARFQHSFVHQVYRPDGTIEDSTTGPGTDAWTPIEDISPYMQVAVMTTEDAGFLSHHGFNRASIRASVIANLKARRFVRGASTITMQLAKNLFLVRDKTISRKLEEVILTDYLEQTFSKRELMELYLNVIEFGPAIYGVGAAADYYFGRTPAELNLSECLFLASLLPAPVRYGAMRDAGEVPEGWMRTIHALLATAHRNGRITDAELAEAEKEPVVFWRGGDRPTPRTPVRSRPGLGGTTDQTTATPALDPPEGP
jgi:hypothetical protein